MGGWGGGGRGRAARAGRPVGGAAGARGGALLERGLGVEPRDGGQQLRDADGIVAVHVAARVGEDGVRWRLEAARVGRGVLLLQLGFGALEDLSRLLGGEELVLSARPPG